MILRVLTFAFLVIGAILLTVFFSLRLSLPKVEGRSNVYGISASVAIIRDQHGIPTVRSESDRDAFFGLGFAHAQDRLWQMEMERRLVSGRISEVLGETGLASDKLMRILGLRRNTYSDWEELDEGTKELIRSYVEGVNSSIKAYVVYPPEFIYFGIRPEPWTVYDTLSMIQSMAFRLSGNHREELQRSSLISIFGQKKALELRTELTDHDIASIDEFEAIVSEIGHLAGIGTNSVSRSGGFYIGSNAWAVSGKHTIGGKPMLASDPHLPTTAPSAWYIARLEGRNLAVSGATLPGFPFVLFGENDKIGWAVTNLGADVQDLRVEKFSLVDPDVYIKDGRPRKVLKRTEFIAIRSSLLQGEVPPFPLVIRETVNGPIISDALGEVYGRGVSLSWIANDGVSGTVESFRKLMYAGSWAQFLEALETYVAPSQNFLYVDTEGNIGSIAAGKIPIRRLGQGMLPVPGWDSRYDWEGTIPFPELPRTFNPDSGYVVSANNKIVSDEYEHFITRDWAPPFRADRIRTLLERKIKRDEKLTAEYFKEMQADTVSEAALLLIRSLKNIKGSPLPSDDIFKILGEWDGNVSSQSRAASLYQVWLKTLNRLLLEDEKDIRGLSHWEAYSFAEIVNNPNYAFLIDVFSGKNANWCDYKTSQETESCERIINIAADRAKKKLSKKIGNTSESWEWGRLHRVQYYHFPFSKRELSSAPSSLSSSLLHHIFHLSESSSGDENTINVSFVSGESGPREFQQFLGATYRQIIDASNFENSLYSISPGQSGNVLSRHYTDWRKSFSRSEMTQVRSPKKIRSSLVLTPSAAKHEK